MDKQKIHLIKQAEKSHRVRRPSQTGFSSPATHYNEPRIDLNSVLVKNSSATFYVRVIDDKFQDFGICNHDVLIVDKSLVPTTNQLAVVVIDGAFTIIRIRANEATEADLWGVITYIIKSVR